MTAGIAPEPPRPAETTLEEWAAMGEDEPGELVDGRVVKEEAPSVLHEAIVAWLIRTLSAWLLPRGGWGCSAPS